MMSASSRASPSGAATCASSIPAGTRTASPTARTPCSTWLDKWSMPRHVRVLLVDDDDELRQVYASVLRECGLGVDEASSADEAMRRLPAHAYDVILSD